MNIDYHVELHGHYYSLPHPLSHELVDARLTVATVELFHRGQRVATHVRSHLRGRHTTDPAHMPKAHQLHLRRLVASMSLLLAGIDLRRTPDGQWFCLEVNPSPGFTYYESATGQPIADSIACVLAAR